MSAEEHRAQARHIPVLACVVVVSTTRTLKSDTSGRAIASLLTEADHTVRDTLLVDDDEELIRQTVRSLIASGIELIVLTGGTGLGPRDVTPEALQPLWTRRMDGFGEIFRWLSYQQVGSAAMLSRAVGGLVERTVVFALPGSTRACELAMRELILPELGHLVHVSRGVAAPVMPMDALAEPAHGVATPVMPADVLSEPPAGAPPGGPLAVALSPSVGDDGASAAASAGASAEGAEGAPEAAPGWLRAIQRVGGVLLRGEREPLPEALQVLAPVRGALETAGEQAVLEAHGRRYSLWGFPDLRRPGSRVLAVGPGGGLAEVVALHRERRPAGTCVDGGFAVGRAEPGVEPTLEAIAIARTGRVPPEPGRLFALSEGVIYLERDGRIARWDGRRLREEGSARQVLASLVLEWSQR